MWKEFKKFAFKGNVIDMATGVIIGGAFGKIVTSLVNDIIMPPIGVLVGQVSFSELKIVLVKATEEVAEVAITYGKFVQTVIDFSLTALSIFMFISVITKGRELLNKKEREAAEARSKAEAEAKAIADAEEAARAAAEPKKPTTEDLLGEIRDLLREKK